MLARFIEFGPNPEMYQPDLHLRTQFENDPFELTKDLEVSHIFNGRKFDSATSTQNIDSTVEKWANFWIN